MTRATPDPSPDGETNAAGHSEPTRSRILVERTAKLGFTALVLVFGAMFVASRWDGLTDALRAARWEWVAAAAVLGAAGQIAAMLGFRVLLVAVTLRPIPRVAAARAFFVSQLGKYIPGSIWPVVAMASMSRGFDLSARAAAGALLMSMLVSVVVGAFAGAGVASFSMGWPVGVVIGIALILALVAFMARPTHVLDPITRLVRRFGRRQVQSPNPRVARAAASWPLLAWMLLGLHCWALVVALGGPPGRSLAPAVGGFALAYVAGMVFLPAPGGLGVREAVLAVILSSALGSAAGFDDDRVVAVVLTSRVILAFVDFALAAGATTWSRVVVPEGATTSTR